MSCLFPVDPRSVKKFGLNRWLEETLWPVSDRESLKLYDEVHKAYLETIRSASTETKDALFVMYKLNIEFHSVIHARIVLNRIRDLGFKPSYEPGTVSAGHYQSMSGQGLKGLYELYPSYTPRIPGIQESVRSRLRAVRRGGLRTRQDCVRVYGLVTPAVVRYAELVGGRARTIFPFPLRRGARLNTAVREECLGATATFVQQLSRIGETYGVQLTDEEIEVLRELASTTVVAAAETIAALVGHLRKLRAMDIAVTKLGNTLVRCLCVSGGRSKHRVVGFTHGDVFGLRRSFRHATLELFVPNRYVVPTKGAAKLWENTGRQHAGHLGRPYEIFSTDDNRYWRMWHSRRREQQSKKIHRLMILEYPLTDVRHQNRLAFWPFQIRFTAELGMAVRKLGIHSILKLHPDRLTTSSDLYNGKFDEIMTEPFEHVSNRADAFAFTNVATTTFIYALLTNKPVILFDFQLEDFWEEARDLLADRCRIVETSESEDGQPCLIQESLEHALSSKIKEPSGAFAETLAGV